MVLTLVDVGGLECWMKMKDTWCSPFPRRWDSKWSSEYKTKSSMVKVHVSFQMRPLKRRASSKATARFREDETRNGHQNTKRNPRWSKFRSLFEWDLWKETCDDHRGFRFVWHSDGHFESHLLGNGLFCHQLYQNGIAIPPRNREIPFETPRTPLLLVISGLIQ